MERQHPNGDKKTQTTTLQNLNVNNRTKATTRRSRSGEKCTTKPSPTTTVSSPTATPPSSPPGNPLTHKFLVDTYHETTISGHKIKLYALILWPFVTYSIKKSWERGLVGEVAEEGREVGVGGNAHFFAQAVARGFTTTHFAECDGGYLFGRQSERYEGT